MTSETELFLTNSNGSIEPTTSLDKKNFIYGNPFVEKKVGGVLHFRKNVNNENKFSNHSLMLCMIDVPAFFTCRELIKFVSPMADNIFHMRIIRDDTPNQYMVLIKFKTPEMTVSFYEQYNDMEFNSIEHEKCLLLFVERLELTSGADPEIFEPLTSDSLTSKSAPNCSVCLERMDDGLLTILCNHTFHAECLRKWSDTTCPVCRNSQTPELVPSQTCKDCGETVDLWMCLICGNIGCGRYLRAHAYKHYEATSHIFTLQVGGKNVWDYASDHFVHRLIQDSTDGKVVEYEEEDPYHSEKNNEKLDAIQMEYSFLMTSQLDTQRMYFEEKLIEAEEQKLSANKIASAKILNLETTLENKLCECTMLQNELSTTIANKLHLERKNTQLLAKLSKLQQELDHERQINKLFLKDKEILIKQRDELEKLRIKEIANLEEQLHDLMMHFETQSKIQNVFKKENISKEELKESKLEINGPTSSNNQKKKNQRKKS